jgi:Arylsulfotransferase (ASST)
VQTLVVAVVVSACGSQGSTPHSASPPGGGGNAAVGGGGAIGGAPSATGGAGGAIGCSFSLITNGVSSMMPTVGVVEWSTTLSNPKSAQIVYTLNDADPSVLNPGGTAPVDPTRPNYRTLLLGLKQSSDYTFHIEATDANGVVCRSSDYALPTTGVLTGAPSLSRTASNPSAQAKGFIVTSSGVTYGDYAIIVDADGAVVWYAASPIQCTRARMDYEGVNLWMVGANEDNSGGEMRFVSMDGQTSMTNIAGLAKAHHDFAVLPGKIAAMEWTTTDVDSESNLVEMNADGSGSPTSLFEIGSNLYLGSSIPALAPRLTYHSNSILYHLTDDSFTIGDRNPNLYVKVSHTGAILWQFGGSCDGAPAGVSDCVPESWQVNHGHDLLDDGTLLVFNNNTSGPSDVREFKLSELDTLSATPVKDFTWGDLSSPVLGDVQRLPNGNTLIAYSVAGEILEVDPSWAPVQTITGSYGYVDWRETLYGPPAR